MILRGSDCGLCSASAPFVIFHFRRGKFCLTAMPGAAGAELARTHGIDPDDTVTILPVLGDRATQDRVAVPRV